MPENKFNVSHKDTSTKELTEELITREGITTIDVDPHQPFSIKLDGKEIPFTGPAIVIVNQD